MHTAALRLELRLRDIGSLKEKRHVVKSLIAHLTSTFGVAAAEVGHLDKWQRSTVGVAVVGGAAGHVERVLHTVRTSIAEHAGVELLDYSVSYLEDPE